MKLLVLLGCVAVAVAKPVEDDMLGSVIGVVRSCSDQDVTLCLKVCVQDLVLFLL